MQGSHSAVGEGATKTDRQGGTVRQGAGERWYAPFHFSLLARSVKSLAVKQRFCLLGPRMGGIALAAAGVLSSSVVAGRALAQDQIQAPGEAPRGLLQESGGNAAASVPAGSVGGMGDVNLYPRRVVISDRERSATVGLYNRAASVGEYDIAINDMVMLPDGRLVDLAAAPDAATAGRVKVASPMLRWSPRKVLLPANEAQLVRIMVRIPPDLPAGEYRSHFSAVSVPPVADGLTIEQASGDQAAGVGVQILPRFGISIPVIVRVGPTTAKVGLQDFAIERGATPTVSLTITREGTRSVFGNLAVMAPGSKLPVAQIKGIGVYTELDHRTIQIPIDPKVDPATYRSGAKLDVIYTDDDYAPGQVLAKADFAVR